MNKGKFVKKYSDEVRDFIKENSVLNHSELQRLIFNKFNIEIPKDTIRTIKRTENSLSNLKELKKKHTNFIKKNYLKYSDKELAEILSKKYRRKIAEGYIKKNKRFSRYT